MRAHPRATTRQRRCPCHHRRHRRRPTRTWTTSSAAPSTRSVTPWIHSARRSPAQSSAATTMAETTTATTTTMMNFRWLHCEGRAGLTRPSELTMTYFLERAQRDLPLRAWSCFDRAGRCKLGDSTGRLSARPRRRRVQPRRSPSPRPATEPQRTPWRQRTSVAVSDSGKGAARATPARQQYGWPRPVGQTITTAICADMGHQGYPQGAIPEWPWAVLSAPLSQTAL